MFGSHSVCGAFPTRSPLITSKHQNAISVQDGACIVRLGPEDTAGATGTAGSRKGNRYICFDEAFFKNLERMQWDRNNSFVELIPIVVGLSS